MPEPLTILSSVRALPPGSALIVAAGQSPQLRNLLSLSEAFNRPVTEASVEALQAALLDSIKHHLDAKADATAMAVETLYRERRLSMNAIAEKLHISKSTPYHYLRHRCIEIGS